MPRTRRPGLIQASFQRTPGDEWPGMSDHAGKSDIHDLSHAMSYIRDMFKATATMQLARQLGDALRAERKRLGLTQAALARRAGIGRQKLIQVEQGKPGVALAAYTAAMDALDLVPAVKPAEVRIEEYPQLKRLIWNRPGAEVLAERDALAIYERHWDLVDVEQMTAHERILLQRLVDKYGQGVLHV